MTDKRSSTGMTALAAFNEDPEVRRLIRGLESQNPGRGEQLAYELIMRNLSTSALTADYGQDRPSAFELFKAELRMLAGDDEP